MPGIIEYVEKGRVVRHGPSLVVFEAIIENVIFYKWKYRLRGSVGLLIYKFTDGIRLDVSGQIYQRNVVAVCIVLNVKYFGIS